MAVKFSQFNVGATVSDIDYIVGYKSTDNVQIPIGLVTANTTYTVATAQSGLNETLTLTGSDASTDVITFTAGANITLTDDGVGNGFTIQAKGNVDGTGTANSITKWADADTITDSIMSETAAGGQFTDPYITVAGAGGGVSTQNLEINGFLLDSNGQKGTAGQILSSTGTLTDWITPAAGETYDLNSTTDGANVDVNLTSTSGTDNSSVKLVPAGGITISQVGNVVTLDTSASGTGTVTSVGTTTTGIAALTLSGTVTTSGDLDLAKTGGTAGQYIDGALGVWTTLPAGDTYTLQAGAKAGTSVPLQLDAAAGADSTVSLTEGTGITLTQNSATEITIASAAGVTMTTSPAATGDGATATYPLGATPTDENFTMAYISGVYQLKSSYSVTGSNITFDTNVPNGASIEVVTTT